jgi:hypothetical protein
MPILAYDNNPGKITFFSKYETFPRCKLTPDTEPSVPGANYNRLLRFISREPGVVNVDWGDGSKDQYSFVRTGVTQYQVAFKSLDANYYSRPENGFSDVLSLYGGGAFNPNNYHRYTDGVDNHVIVFEFSNSITGLYGSYLYYGGFPILDVPDLKELSLAGGTFSGDAINADKIGRSVNINIIYIGGLVDHTPQNNWDEGFLKLTDLTIFSCNGNYDFSDLDNNNFRECKVWKKMGNLNLNQCHVPKYVKEFLEMPELYKLGLMDDRNDETMPDFSEVYAINPAHEELQFLDTSTRTWKENLVEGKGLQYMKNLYASTAIYIPVDSLPEYIKEMRSMELFKLAQALRSQDRVDSFINSWYDYVVSWNNLTMEQNALDGDRNQFYGMKLELYDAEFPNNSVRPSGTLQAPSGFVQGQSNGTPATPMEKIYVLTNNYKQVWTLKPEETASDAARALTAATPYSLSIVEDRVYFGTGDMISPGEVFNFQTPDDAKRFLTSFNYPIEVIDEYVKQQNEGGPA